MYHLSFGDILNTNIGFRAINQTRFSNNDFNCMAEIELANIRSSYFPGLSSISMSSVKVLRIQKVLSLW
jgi:hypothetical protein